MKLLAVVLLLLPLSGCLAEVVKDFTQNCPLNRPQFFITVNNTVTPPTVFSDNNNKDRYKQICQTLNNKAEFATLYDTENKIPVYSAYRFEGYEQCERKSGDWYIEPQLDYPHPGRRNMELERNTEIHPNQSLNGDYKISGFHRGHLAPVYQANSQSCAFATFTLTNAAPQNPSFNSGKWRVTERNMAKILIQYCTGLQVYVITGVVPGTTTMNNRVRVPSHFWTAFCCLNNNKAVHSSGYIGENRQDAIVERMRVNDLELKLTDLYTNQLPHTHRFILFGGTCYTENQKIVQDRRNLRPIRRHSKKNRKCQKGLSKVKTRREK
ncbi:endonuclease domain-containing 1 protein-like [Clarias gariepinus]